MARAFAKSFFNSKVWKKQRQYMLMKAKYLCEECGQAGQLEVHHIIELTPENINNYSISLSENNLKVLCNKCHFKQHRNKREEIPDEYIFDDQGYPIKIINE